MTTFQVLVVIVLGVPVLLVVVYLLIRLGAAAYFRSKYEALSKHFVGKDMHNLL